MVVIISTSLANRGGGGTGGNSIRCRGDDCDNVDVDEDGCIICGIGTLFSSWYAGFNVNISSHSLRSYDGVDVG